MLFPAVSRKYISWYMKVKMVQEGLQKQLLPERHSDAWRRV